MHPIILSIFGLRLAMTIRLIPETSLKFQTSELVYVPGDGTKDSQDSQWMALDACVWDGPKCLKKTPRLRDFYKDHGDLFCGSLGLTAANLKTLVSEAKLITSKDSLPYIRALFMQLSHMLYGTFYSTRLDAHFDDLLELKIFPVWTGKPGARFNDLLSARVTEESDCWYIADAQHIRDAFVGKVSLLAFEPHMLDGIKDLIASLRWQSRMLRKLAIMKVSAEGFDIVNDEYTQSLQSKWRCIARYVSPEVFPLSVPR